MSTSEILASLDFIKTKLGTDATLVSLATGGIHTGAAPVGTVAPWIVLAFQGGHDALTLNGIRFFAHLLFQVKAVGQSSILATLFQMSALIDDLFKRTSGTVTGGYISSCYREQPLHYPEMRPDGTEWTHTGGLYHHIVEQV
jgi:hypothetical protein